MTEPPEGPRPDYLSQHLGLVLSGITTLVVTAQVLRLSHFDLPTALAVVQVAGIQSVLLGGLISIVPFALAMLCTALLFLFRAASRQLHGLDRAALRMLVPACCWAFASLVPLYLLAVLVVVAVAPAAWRSAKRALPLKASAPEQDTPERDKGMSRVELTAVSLTGCLYFLMLFTANPWLPAESIDPSGSDAFTGYVIGERGEKLLVLPKDADAALVELPTSVKRSICSTSKGFWDRPLTSLGEEPLHEKCPSP